MDFYTLHLDPVAFAIGPLVVRWYALAYLSGFLLGWHYCRKLVSHNDTDRPNGQDIDDFLTWAVVGVILGGRLGYVLFYQLDFYMDQPMEIWKVWRGGMSFHGGMLGVLVAMVLYAKRYKINVFKLADIVSAAAPIGLFFGRIANFINGELFGRPTNLPWGIIFPNGGDMPRHPSQLYEAALEGAVLFIILFLFMRYSKLKAGVSSGIFLAGYGVFRAMIEFAREPDVQLGLIGGFMSMGQILCIPMVIIGAVLIVLGMRGTLSEAD